MVPATKRFEAAGHPGLAYEELGNQSAPPVVLLHGGGGFRGSWQGIPVRLAEMYRVLNLDLRGHGDSDWSKDGYRIDLYSSDVEAFVERVAGRRATLVGHSLGGVVAAHVAGTRPELVAGAFFEDAPLHWTAGRRRTDRPAFSSAAFADRVQELGDRSAGVSELMTAVFQAFAETGNLHRPFQQVVSALTAHGVSVDEIVAGLREVPLPTDVRVAKRFDDATMRSYVHGLLACDPRVLAPGEDWLAAYDRDRAMSCPVLMLRADPTVGPPPVGAAFPPEDEERFLATHRSATVEFAPGVGHAMHMQAPELFVEELEAFLGKVACLGVTSGTRQLTSRTDTNGTRFGVVLPAAPDPGALLDLARSAERAGVGSVWMRDSFVGDDLEALTMMSAVAAVTHRVEIGAYMLNASLRDPALLARMISCLDRLAPGRIRVVLGTGWDRGDYEALAMDFPSPDIRTQRTEKALAIIKRGTDASVEVAGVHDDVLRIAASHADGWAISSDALDAYFERSAFLRRACEMNGRDFGELRLSCTLPAGDGASDRIADLAEHGMVEFRFELTGHAHQSDLERLLRSVTS